jgi:hypothetical protein
MQSENLSGADNQQGSPRHRPVDGRVTPQRLHAELLAAGKTGLEAYLLGSLCDGTYSARHGTYRFTQREIGWLQVIQDALSLLGYRSWIYREGKERNVWAVETAARFLTCPLNYSSLSRSADALHYVRGYFDADGGIPRHFGTRLYVQMCQKDRVSLERVVTILESHGIRCGRIHNPSVRVDPDYWRFFVKTESHISFLRDVSSWHPVKRQQMNIRMKI